MRELIECPGIFLFSTKYLLCCMESADIRHFEVCRTNREGVRCFDIIDKVKKIGIYL